MSITAGSHLKCENITEEIITNLVETSMISKPRDKELKDTASWSSNIMIKLFFKVKELSAEKEFYATKNIKYLVEILKQNQSEIVAAVLSSDPHYHNYILKVEDSGYLTLVTKEAAQEVKISKVVK